MMPNRKEFGKHYLVEFVGCDPDRLKNEAEVVPAFLKAAQESGATILGSHSHQFKPYGVSAMIFIAESHFSLHTWPEDGYAAFDVLTCGQMSPEKAIASLKDHFKAQRVEVDLYSRGYER